jgi:hypothetical protein
MGDEVHSLRSFGYSVAGDSGMKSVRRETKDRAMAPRRGGYSLVEAVVAVLVAAIVLVVVWELFSALMGRRNRAGVVSMTASSFLRREAVDGLGILVRRLQEGIQIVSPLPGATADTLTFQDLLNDRITIQVANGALIATGPQGEEGAPVPLSAGGVPFFPVKPVRVPGCVEAQFSAISPTCVVVTLRFQDANGESVAAVDTIRLQNSDLAR